ncbi:MAG: hypothetical protein R3E67_07470 [Pseudomonadales bacterium]
MRNIPPMVAGAAHIRVTFKWMPMVLLDVSARENSSSVQAPLHR